MITPLKPDRVAEIARTLICDRLRPLLERLQRR
jgi:hypothetical protein